MKLASKTQNLLPKYEISFQNMKFASKTQKSLPKYENYFQNSKFGFLLPGRIYRPNALFIFTKASGSGAINSRRLREAPTPDNISGKRMR